MEQQDYSDFATRLRKAGRLAQEKSKAREQPVNVYVVYADIIKAQTERRILK